MSTKKMNCSPKGQRMNKKGKLTEKSASFHGRVAEDTVAKLTRPRTVPELISGRSVVATEIVAVRAPRLTKLLVNVTVQRSLGPMHVLMSPEATVGELIAVVLRQYAKECRRPIFSSLEPSGFDLHYSQFSLESIPPEAKLSELGSRNFFLCPKQSATITGNNGGGGVSASSSTCSKEAEKVTKGGAGWLRFMEFML